MSVVLYKRRLAPQSTFVHTNLGESLNSLRLTRAVSYKMAMPMGVYTSTCTGTGTGVARVWVRALNR